MQVTPELSLDKLTFKRLTRLYVIALSAIAISIIISHLVVDNQINSQQQDSYLINLSGRQRMLSQKLSKEAFLIQNQESKSINRITVVSLKKTLTIWSESQEFLIKNKNSEQVSALFTKIDPYYQAIQQATNTIITSVEQDVETADIRSSFKQIHQNEGLFLILMDKIVNQYEDEANDKLDNLQMVEFVIFAITMLLLLIEFLFVYRPAATNTKQIISKLLQAEKKAIKMAYDADLLCEAKDNSVKELRALNYAMDQTLLFCRISTLGDIIHMGDRFSKLLGNNTFVTNQKFSNVLSSQPQERRIIEDLIFEKNKTGWRGELQVTTKSNDKLWLDTTIIPVSVANKSSELLIICLNSTDRKKAQLEVERLNQEQFNNQINQQKVLASKIVENQENEQNRIAKEIHDGIGQMLTGLKFSLESIDLENKQKTDEKITYLKKLTTDIIKGVRTATFNLMPPEIKDYGIASSLLRLTQELHRLTGKNILFFNKTDFNERLDSLIEVNVYRITQEAINNAIKYADSTHIIVMISHSNEILSVTIDDNGIGFDHDEVVLRKNSESGMGTEFMKERIKYINGRVFINSTKGEGTHITLNIPLTT